MKRLKIIISLTIFTAFLVLLTRPIFANNTSYCQILLNSQERLRCASIASALSNHKCTNSFLRQKKGHILNDKVGQLQSICRELKKFLKTKKCTGQEGPGRQLCLALSFFKNLIGIYGDNVPAKNITLPLPKNISFTTRQAFKGLIKGEFGGNCLDLDPSAQSVCFGVRTVTKPGKILSLIHDKVDPHTTISSLGEDCPKTETCDIETTMERFHSIDKSTLDHLHPVPEQRIPSHSSFFANFLYRNQKKLKKHPSYLSFKKILETQLKILSEAPLNIMKWTLKKGSINLGNLSSLVTPKNWPSPLTLTPDQISVLRKRHQALISLSRENAIYKSTIDLDSFRHNNQIVSEFCKSIPKGGLLHIHPTGTLSESFLKKILPKYNPVIRANFFLNLIKYNGHTLFEDEQSFLTELVGRDISFNDLTEVQKNKFISLLFLSPEDYPKNFNSHFARFESIFVLFSTLLNYKNPNKELEKEYYLDFLEDAKKQGIRYVEFTEEFEPTVRGLKHLHSLGQYLEEKTGMIVRFNFSFYRDDPPTTHRKTLTNFLKSIQEFQTSYLSGVDFIGDEVKVPAFEIASSALPYILAFNNSKMNEVKTSISDDIGQFNGNSTNLKITFHAGEIKEKNSNVLHAILFGADRIGHGTNLWESDPLALELAMHKKIPIEISVTSNEVLGISPIIDNPIMNYIRTNIPVVLTTDDPGIMKTNANLECQKIISQTDITYIELKEMYLNSIQYSFLDLKLKSKLKRDLERDLRFFERDWPSIFK